MEDTAKKMFSEYSERQLNSTQHSMAPARSLRHFRRNMFVLSCLQLECRLRWKFPINASCYWSVTANWVTTSFDKFSARSERPNQLNSTQLPVELSRVGRSEQGLTTWPLIGLQRTLFCSCDLDLKPMTLIYEHDLCPLKMYRHTKTELSRSGLLKVEHYSIQTHRQAQPSTLPWHIHEW